MPFCESVAWGSKIGPKNVVLQISNNQRSSKNSAKNIEKSPENIWRIEKKAVTLHPL